MSAAFVKVLSNVREGGEVGAVFGGKVLLKLSEPFLIHGLNVTSSLLLLTLKHQV